MYQTTRLKRKLTEQPLRVIAGGFVVLILLGTLLLMLPAATLSGQSAGFERAIFTATSASCVTGLVIEDTLTYWSGFGKTVILVLIQIGGLGVMMIAGFLFLLLGRRIGVRERMLIGRSISVDDLSGVVRLLRHVLLWTLLIEGVGALLLTIRFAPQFGFVTGLKKGIFHAVSAFCNAGFDLMGDFASLSAYHGDWLVTLVISALVIVGGLGFYVWGDLFRCIRNRDRHNKLRTHTKLVLHTTLWLLLGGTAFILLAEWNNPATIGTLSGSDKVLSAFFQSVTCRTAGFEQVAQAAFTPAGRLFSQILMFIGGSPGSTAGGIKTTTIVIILLAARAALRGNQHTVLYRRTISRKTVQDAVAIMVFGVTMVLGSTALLLLFDPITAEQALFESISAFATVGLSTGVTPQLSFGSHMVLVVLMFIGRVGVMTLGLAALLRAPRQQQIQYAEGKLMI